MLVRRLHGSPDHGARARAALVRTRRSTSSATPGTTRCNYRFRATTRFREYFDPETLAPHAAPAPATAGRRRQERRRAGAHAHRAELGAAGGADRALGAAAVPLGGGHRARAAGRGAAPRRAGVRIYLERPWYSSGEGELVGVLLAPGGDDSRGCSGLVSQWGADPVWVSAPVTPRALLGSTTWSTSSGSTIVPSDAGPVGPPGHASVGRGSGSARL